jgi:hypothetical protein
VDVQQTADLVRVANGRFAIELARSEAWLPQAIDFLAADGRVAWRFAGLMLYDRIYDGHAAYFARLDPKATIAVDTSVDGQATLHVAAQMLDESGAAPSAAAPVRVAYTFVVRADDATMDLAADVARDDTFAWAELQLFQLQYRNAAFERFMVADPYATGTFTRANQVFSGSHWGQLQHGPNTLTLMGGRAFVYDGLDWGSYLHGPWVAEWVAPQERFEQALAIDSGAFP